VVVPHQASPVQRVAAALVYGLIRLVGATVRFRIDADVERVMAEAQGPFLFSIWHNRLALALILYRQFILRRAPTRRMAAMVSASRDGALLARILERFDVEPVRGSTSRRGPQALRELSTWAERGYDLAITPDGPRGPRYTVQEGVTALAQLTGRPILPVSYRLSWKFCLGSWDKFQVPVPFTRCEVRLGALVRVPREASDEAREDLRQQLEQTMRGLTHD
jgi:hypothetical protein